MNRGLQQSRASIAHHSKSFALAARLLPANTRDDTAIVYAWCRRADDRIDLAPPERQRRAVRELRDELTRIYSSAPPDDPVLASFAEVVARRRIPRHYPDELLSGMEMDATRTDYDDLDDLMRYCYRVAGVVGLMMCSVFDVRGQRALQRAVHLGIAMQLTNICRDVEEDWHRGRLYIPRQLLRSCGAEHVPAPGAGGVPRELRAPLSRAVEILLAHARRYYHSADAGMLALPWRVALGVRTARYVYAAIGDVIADRDFEVTAGRAVVPGNTKLRLVARSLARAAAEWPSRMRDPDFGASVLQPLVFEQVRRV